MHFYLKGKIYTLAWGFRAGICAGIPRVIACLGAVRVWLGEEILNGLDSRGQIRVGLSHAESGHGSAAKEGERHGEDHDVNSLELSFFSMFWLELDGKQVFVGNEPLK